MSKNKQLTNPDLSLFSANMAVILKAGLPASEGIEILLEETKGADERAYLTKIKKKLSETGSLYQALKNNPQFPSYLVNMVRLGEETGTLDDVMDNLKTHYDREEELDIAMKNAILYPAAMTIMMIAVIIVLLVYVMPVFNQVFTELGSGLSGISLAFLNIGKWISSYSVILITLIFLIIIATLYCTLTPTGKKIRYAIGSRFRSVRARRADAASCRFADVMAVTLKSGLLADHGIEMAKDLNDDPQFDIKLNRCQELLDQGESLNNAFIKSGIFTGVYARMSSVGARAGSMDEALEQIADLYEDNLNTKLNEQMAVLEPACVIILSLVAGMILLSVMFPLLGILSIL